MSPIYNCISWSVERTDYWEWPGDRGSSYYHPNLLTAFDKLYAHTDIHVLEQQQITQV